MPRPRARRSWRLLGKGIRPRDIVTRRCARERRHRGRGVGGSTNAGLHLPAIAHEAGIDFDLQDVCEIFRRTPYIADLKPAGQYVMRDLHDAGGVPLLMRALLDGGYLHGDCVTVTGRTIAENLADVRFNPEQPVVRPTANPLSPVGGVVGLKGNLAPEGGIVKIAGLEEPALPRSGALLRERGGLYGGGPGPPLRRRRRAGDPLRGAQGRARHARDALGHRRGLRPGQGREGRADHRRRFSGASRGFCIGHIGPEAAVGGPIGLLRDGDMIVIDAEKGPVDVELSDEELAARARGVAAAATMYASGTLWKYAQTAGPAYKGAVTHPGGKAEVLAYVDVIVVVPWRMARGAGAARLADPGGRVWCRQARARPATSAPRLGPYCVRAVSRPLLPVGRCRTDSGAPEQRQGQSSRQVRPGTADAASSSSADGLRCAGSHLIMDLWDAGVWSMSQVKLALT